MKSNKLVAIAIVCWLLAVLTGAYLDRWHEELFLPPPEKRQAEDVMVDVFGDVKTIVARYLWFKMDLFHEVLDEQGVAPERQAEVLPLLRMVSLLDPTITDAFDMLAWDLFWGHQKADEALSLLDEGIRRSENSGRLHFRKGVIYFKLGRYEEAVKSGKAAARLTEDEFEKLDALRIQYWSAKELGDLTSRRDGLEQLLELRPSDPLWLREFQDLNKEEKGGLSL